LLRLPAVEDNAAMQSDRPKRKRRRFQFSLRTLFVVTTNVAIAVWIIRLVWPAFNPLALIVLVWACMLVAIIELLTRTPSDQ
jgi:uncharacterized membrane protein YcjF (UPF0283 family)